MSERELETISESTVNFLGQPVRCWLMEDGNHYLDNAAADALVLRILECPELLPQFYAEMDAVEARHDGVPS